jgi:hypothetical protein
MAWFTRAIAGPDVSFGSETRNLLHLADLGRKAVAAKSRPCLKPAPLPIAATAAPTSGLGQKRKWPGMSCMSVLPSGADIVRLHAQVRLVPATEVAVQKKKPPEGGSQLNPDDR